MYKHGRYVQKNCFCSSRDILFDNFISVGLGAVTGSFGGAVTQLQLAPFNTNYNQLCNVKSTQLS